MNGTVRFAVQDYRSKTALGNWLISSCEWRAVQDEDENSYVIEIAR